MKKFLLFAILVASINISAQSQKQQYQLSDTKVIFKNEIYNYDQNRVNSKDKYFGIDIKHLTNEKFFKSKSIIQLIDSIYYWEWDIWTSKWQVDSKTIDIVYNSNNDIVSRTGQIIDGNIWRNDSHSVYEYDDNFNLLSFLYQNWNWVDSGWSNTWKFTFTYDQNNNRITYLFQRWKNDDWMNSSKNSYAYDGNNNLTSEIQQEWEDDDWKNIRRQEFVYDNTNNKTVHLYQNWNGIDWLNFRQSIYSYNDNNYELNILSQIWEGAWKNVGQYINSYDENNNLSLKLGQAWHDGEWENSTLYFYSYDVSNNLTSELLQTWIDSLWINGTQNLRTYDVNNNITSTTLQIYNQMGFWRTLWKMEATYDINNFMLSRTDRDWSIDGSELEEADSSYYYFYTVVGVEDLITPETKFTLYPNPTNGKITISSDIKLVGIEIYNMLGQQVYSDNKLKHRKTVEIDLSSFVEGVYLVRIGDGRIVSTSKIIIK